MENTQRKRESNPKPHPQCGDCDDRDARLRLLWETRELWPEVNAALSHQGGPETLAAFAIALTLEARCQGRRVSYSRNWNHYAMPRRYRDPLYTYTRVVGAADRLAEAGLVDHFKVAPGNLGWQSAISARPELVGLVGPILDRGLDLRIPREPIILRDRNGAPIDYRDNRETHRMRRELAEQNEAIAGAEFGGPDIFALVAPLRRIFNGDLDHGGRFYAQGGAWQVVSKEDRMKIRIDGEPVVEIDYSQFHPSLAYSLAGHPPPTDAYSVPGFTRDAGKVAFNVMLNGTSRHGARYTLAHDHAELIVGRPLEGERGFQEALAAADHLIDALLAKHEPIRGMCFTSAGLALQRIDSDIAAAVMAEMRRRNVVVLPVHDSFICPESKEAELEAVMVEQAARFGAPLKCRSSAGVPRG